VISRSNPHRKKSQIPIWILYPRPLQTGNVIENIIQIRLYTIGHTEAKPYRSEFAHPRREI